MKIVKMRIKNFRSIKDIQLSLGDFTVLIGRNDVGKSNILYALKLFFEDGKISEEDLFCRRDPNENFVEIEISFSNFPEQIELEENISTSLGDENMLDSEGYLTIMKRFRLLDDGKTKVEVFLKVFDYDHEDFSALCTKNERELNAILKKLGLTYKKAGRSITNQDKRKKRSCLLLG